MSVIGDFSFPHEHFVLREAVGTPEIDVEIERLVAHADEGMTPYFRITAEEFDPVERALEDDPTVDEVERLETAPNERFYRARWTEGSHGLETLLEETRGAVLSPAYAGESWEVRMLFGDREELSDSFERCRELFDGDVDLIRAFDRSNPATYGEYGLTAEQRDALLVALDQGYYEVPKRSDIEDVAEVLDISPQAVSQRLRRGCANLIGSTLGTRDAEEEAAEG
jgi:predicted DNA binding protein